VTEKQTPPKTEAKVQGRDAGKKVDLDKVFGIGCRSILYL
jgi:hypothetical protein